MRKNFRIGFLGLFLFFFISCAYSQIDTTYILDEIKILSQRTAQLHYESLRSVSIITADEIALYSVNSIDDVLNYALGVDVRQRGVMGVQSDISIRAGTFEQYAVLINGVKVNDPQTGHHNLNLPIDIGHIERIEVLTGSAARLYGGSAFSGAINFITKEVLANEIILNAEYGHYSYINGGLLLLKKNKFFNHSLSFRHKQSDGYRENTDFKSTHIFWVSEQINSFGKMQIQTGLNDKRFGANGFYTPQYPYQFEHINAFISSAKFETKNILNLCPIIYYRRHQDRFELFREDYYQKNNGYYIFETDTAIFKNSRIFYKGHNYHVTHAYGASLNSNYYTNRGKLSTSFNYNNDLIYSNVLGQNMLDTLNAFMEKDGFYTKKGERSAFSFVADYIYMYKKISFSGGGMLYYVHKKPLVFPGIDLGYQLSSNMRINLSLNKSMRLPSFTELYYKSPNHINNENLKPEEAASGEIGLKYNNYLWQCGSTIYRRQSKNSIDWIKDNDSLLWRADNISKVNTYGAELFAILNVKNINSKQPLNQIHTQMVFNKADKYTAVDSKSMYVMDYLKRKLVFIFYFDWGHGFKSSCSIMHQKRIGVYIDYPSMVETPYKPFITIEAKIIYALKNMELYVNGFNLSNTVYYDLGNLPLPGRWFSLGFIYKPKFKKLST